jgi:hypothetical protein
MKKLIETLEMGIENNEWVSVENKKGKAYKFAEKRGGKFQ